MASLVTNSETKPFLISYKMAVSFEFNNFDFPPLYFYTASKLVSSVPASVTSTTACRSSSWVSALFHKPLSDPTNTCDDTVCSSNAFPSKPICPSKYVCLSNVRPSKPINSSNFYLSKPVCPRNINSSRSIHSSDVSQSQSNVIPSKPVRPSNVYPRKPVGPSNVILSKPIGPSNVILSKPVHPSNVCLSKTVHASKFIPVNLFLLVIFAQINLSA